MRFALFGDHPDGLDMARALVESGRHALVYYSGPTDGMQQLTQCNLSPRSVGDIEEVLADPSIEAIIVAGRPAVRAAQLRRALQSERHVLCVHPVDSSPDAAYEAAMMQADTGRLLMPILVEALHPGIASLAKLAQTAQGPLGKFQMVAMERRSPHDLTRVDSTSDRLSLPGWDSLRALRGEIAEVSAFAAHDHSVPDEPILVHGRFEQGGLFHVTLLPRQSARKLHIAIIGTRGQADLDFPAGWPGPAHLSWRDETSAVHEESWASWNPGPLLVETFENALKLLPAPRIHADDGHRPSPPKPASPPGPSWHPCWQDAVRSTELDDAARRSIERRRASTLDYQEVSEEVGFKGTMTLVGCGVLWGIILMLILSPWFPSLRWVSVALLAGFLILQGLRWVIPPQQRL
jgi:predicted dehydrogenase